MLVSSYTTPEKEVEIPFWATGATPFELKRKTSYFVEPGKVSVCNSSYVTGINRHSGKRYYRWQSGISTTFKIGKNGKINYFVKSNRNFLAEYPSHLLKRDKEFAAYVAGTIGDVSFDRIYPLASHWKVTENSPRYGLGGALKQDDLRGMVEHIFGKTRYRRHLAKAVANAPLWKIAIAKEFRGLVPIDWIVEFLNNPVDDRNINHQGLMISGIKLRKRLKEIDPRSLRPLLQEQLTSRNIQAIIDICRGWDLRVTGRYNTWDEMHNAIYVRNRRLEYAYETRLLKPKKIVQNDVAKKLDEVVLYDDVKIVTAKSTGDLQEWGDEFRNCIGSYTYVANSKTVTLGSIMAGDKMIVNWEISNGRLSQFLGKCNQDTGNKELCAAFEALCSQNGIKTDSYLGKYIDSRVRF